MGDVHFEGRTYALEAGETVLDGLLRGGVAVPHSCRAGACQSCLMKACDRQQASGPAFDRAQAGLKDTLRSQGYFLACSLKPEADLAVALPGAEARTAARITGLALLNGSVLQVRLKPERAFLYFAGQFLSLFREDGLGRSYSLASLPHEDEMELHIRRVPGGAMSEWLHTRASDRDTVWVQGPAGNCFYVPGNPEQPLILAGAGTGLAPLYGIVRDALSQGHSGPIWLFHGALTPAGLYLTQELRRLAEQHPNLHYIRSVLQDGEADGIHSGSLDQCIKTMVPNLAGWKAYVCGDPALVNSLRKKLFLAGVASKAIYADAFLSSSPPPS